MRRLLEELNAASRKSVLFVTHDIDEALLVAERLVILSSRPGRVLTEFAVELPRPREERLRTLPRFGELRNAITELMLTNWIVDTAPSAA
jgi:ABC-type nitrate/sulfonate/bicarbonate transport system ATPase subunit